MDNYKKTILVTGGSRGIGFEIVSNFLKKNNLIFLNYTTDTKHLQNFISRFSANASKSRQATSRKKLLAKIE